MSVYPLFSEISPKKVPTLSKVRQEVVPTAITRPPSAFVLLISGEEEAGAGGILWIYVAVLAAVVIGVLIALRQRFKEISKGEEDEAKKY